MSLFQLLRVAKCVKLLNGSSADIEGSFNYKCLKRFRIRYPRISIRTRAVRSNDERNFTGEVCEKYIEKLLFLKEKGYLDDTRRILNVDESPFKTGCQRSRVLGTKGAKRVESISKGETSCAFMLPYVYLHVGIHILF